MTLAYRYTLRKRGDQGLVICHLLAVNRALLCIRAERNRREKTTPYRVLIVIGLSLLRYDYGYFNKG